MLFKDTSVLDVSEWQVCAHTCVCVRTSVPVRKEATALGHPGYLGASSPSGFLFSIRYLLSHGLNQTVLKPQAFISGCHFGLYGRATDSGWSLKGAGRKNSGSLHTHQISPHRTITHLFVLPAGTAAGFFWKLFLSLVRQSGSFKIETENEEMLEMSLLLRRQFKNSLDSGCQYLGILLGKPQSALC